MHAGTHACPHALARKCPRAIMHAIHVQTSTWLRRRSQARQTHPWTRALRSCTPPTTTPPDAVRYTRTRARAQAALNSTRTTQRCAMRCSRRASAWQVVTVACMRGVRCVSVNVAVCVCRCSDVAVAGARCATELSRGKDPKRLPPAHEAEASELGHPTALLRCMFDKEFGSWLLKCHWVPNRGAPRDGQPELPSVGPGYDAGARQWPGQAPAPWLPFGLSGLGLAGHWLTRVAGQLGGRAPGKERRGPPSRPAHLT